MINANLHYLVRNITDQMGVCDISLCYLSDVIHLDGYQDRFLAFGPEQHPIVLQIGGNDLENIAKATQLANPYGYDEINFKFVLLLQAYTFNSIL